MMISVITKANGGGHRKCQLVTGELSGGSRSGVGGEQKLCKLHTEWLRGPRTCSLTLSLSVYTFLYPLLHVVCLSDNVFLHRLSSLNAFQIVLHIDQDVTSTFLSIYSKHCLQCYVYSRSVWAKGLSKHLQHKQHLKAFAAPGLSSFSSCGFARSKEGCSCVIVRKSFIATLRTI